MAYIAVKSDQKNQEKYKQQQAEILQRIADKKALEQKKSLEMVTTDVTQ